MQVSEEHVFLAEERTNPRFLGGYRQKAYRLHADWCDWAAQGRGGRKQNPT